MQQNDREPNFVITFGVSRSRDYREAIELASLFSRFTPAKDKGGINRLEPTLEELRTKHRVLRELNWCIQSWRSTTIYLDGKVLMNHEADGFILDYDEPLSRSLNSNSILRGGLPSSHELSGKAVDYETDDDIDRYIAQIFGTDKCWYGWTDVVYGPVSLESPAFAKVKSQMVSRATTLEEWMAVYYVGYWPEQDDIALQDLALEQIGMLVTSCAEWLSVYCKAVPGSSLESLAVSRLTRARQNADQEVGPLPGKYRAFRMNRDDMARQQEEDLKSIPEFGDMSYDQIMKSLENEDVDDEI